LVIRFGDQNADRTALKWPTYYTVCIFTYYLNNKSKF